ncbi:MAG: exodeoxyribonuclease III [Gammaproteobacteria bacterium]|nr:exodeoxyribonuclease III [Gammaproteobacteria bacterium]
MKIVSFNVNSIRQRLHQLGALVERHAPEFIGLQETKVQDHEFPLSEIEALGYHAIFAGQKTHYGVALFSKSPCVTPVYGFPGDSDDAQKRFIGGEFEINGKKIHVFNGYFPQGEARDHPVKFPAKRKFYLDLSMFIENFDLSRDHVVVVGDYNIAPQDIDIGIGLDNAKRWLKTGKASFLPEEREWLETLLAKGFHDGFRLCHADKNDIFSWFDYRSKGFDREPRRGLRIDHLLVSESLRHLVKDAGVDYDIRAMQKPSDHAPTWISLEYD